ncbi:MAG: DUF3105 domain-containing protein [Alphaproteobacteria bacterium]
MAFLVVGAAAVTYWMLSVGQQESAFRDLAEGGRASLTTVENVASEGRGHLQPGQTVTYRSNPPTSGIHSPTWTDPGIYDQPQPSTGLVHALEHGNIVIYTDRPDQAVMEILTGWAGIFRGKYSGIVMTPRTGIGKAVILTAWNRILRLDPFDAAAAAAFIDRYRGRGPEHPVR